MKCLNLPEWITGPYNTSEFNKNCKYNSTHYIKCPCLQNSFTRSALPVAAHSLADLEVQVALYLRFPPRRKTERVVTWATSQRANHDATPVSLFKAQI